MASIPVIAVAPEENARSTRRTPSPSVAGTVGGGVAAKPWPAALISPTITISAIATANRYVGPANTEPAVRTPRRLPATRIPITAIPIGTVALASEGIADVTAATPAAIDTVT